MMYLIAFVLFITFFAIVGMAIDDMLFDGAIWKHRVKPFFNKVKEKHIVKDGSP